jgi:DNA (cytosine-5)-methyltransferase 1
VSAKFRDSAPGMNTASALGADGGYGPSNATLAARAEHARPRLLDLFCGAGGAAMGYHEAGFEVVGVDIAPQPRYPFEFHQADALTFPLEGFDAIHASPPCQAWCALTRASGTQGNHPDLLTPTRDRLAAEATSPWVIENVNEARHLMPNATLLCGAALGLEVVRHRLFLTNWLLMSPGCAHVRGGTVTGQYVAFRPRGRVAPGRTVPPRRGRALWRQAVGIDWMTGAEVAQAIPPAYTRFIGEALLAHLGVTA